MIKKIIHCIIHSKKVRFSFEKQKLVSPRNSLCILIENGSRTSKKKKLLRASTRILIRLKHIYTFKWMKSWGWTWSVNHPVLRYCIETWEWHNGRYRGGQKNIRENESACISSSPGLWNVKKGKNASGQLTMPGRNAIKTETHQPDARKRWSGGGRE